MDFYQIRYVHWYCRDLLRDCSWVNFVNFWHGLSASHMIMAGYYHFTFWQSYLPMTHLYFRFRTITCFGIANGQISSIFDSYLPKTYPYFSFRTITCVNFSGFSGNLIHVLILWRSGLGLLMGRFCQFVIAFSAHDVIMVGYYHSIFLLWHNVIHWIIATSYNKSCFCHGCLSICIPITK